MHLQPFLHLRSTDLWVSFLTDSEFKFVNPFLTRRNALFIIVMAVLSTQSLIVDLIQKTTTERSGQRGEQRNGPLLVMHGSLKAFCEKFLSKARDK